MKYLVSQVESWREEIAALPSPDPGRRKVGKGEAILLLAKDLQAAARRGFSTAELLEVLATKGLTVHADTLRAALRKAGRGARSTTARTRRRAGEGHDRGAGTEPFTTAAPMTAGAGESDGELTVNDTIERSEGTRPLAGDAVEVAPAGDKVDDPKVGRAEHDSTNDPMQAVAAERTAGEFGCTPGPDDDADAAADRALVGDDPEIHVDGEAAPPPAVVAAAGERLERPGASVAERARASPAPAFARGTFTPRSDSEDL